jgi:hypothetical protein
MTTRDDEIISRWIWNAEGKGGKTQPIWSTIDEIECFGIHWISSENHLLVSEEKTTIRLFSAWIAFGYLHCPMNNDDSVTNIQIYQYNTSPCSLLFKCVCCHLSTNSLSVEISTHLHVCIYIEREISGNRDKTATTIAPTSFVNCTREERHSRIKKANYSR